ncbi:MAG: L-serine ammonia-lyase [Gammaproteobacteria bacterium]|nr:L-serine ammonia-lyase [Gammaproteobacteria bacterium]MCP5299447.1 L-serine ammonia-lyase [Chromatiaceae bacterium]
MFIGVLELFKIGIGPSSSHTVGPMVAARDFLLRVQARLADPAPVDDPHVRCTLRGSLAYTGKGHATDRAVNLGLHGFHPADLAVADVDAILSRIEDSHQIDTGGRTTARFNAADDIVFDRGEPLPQHPNGMIFELLDASGAVCLAETYFSIGGGFVSTAEQMGDVVAPLQIQMLAEVPYPFDSAAEMLRMADDSGLDIAAMKLANERMRQAPSTLDSGIDAVWKAMRRCVQNGLAASGALPGALALPRRAKALYGKLLEQPGQATVNDWLCAYAMAVNEENAAGHMVVTAPTNGAAGVIPAVMYYLVEHQGGSDEQVRTFLLTAAAVGGLIKHRSSISGAEVGCQGEVGSAAAMAAAGLCAVRGGTPRQVENAAEIALEHHLGLTCDPVGGLVQVPCIERNGFGAIKAFTAASLAMLGSGQHYMPLDACIAAMKQTGLEMSHKYKETSLGGLAVSLTEC